MNNKIKIEKPETLNQIAYKIIRDQILSGELDRGVYYSANRFSKILGISRTPIREALLQLTNEGFLIATDKKGFMIRQFTERDIKDFFELRSIIEPFVASRLVGKLKKDELDSLTKILDLMTECAGKQKYYDFLRLDRDFHMKLIEFYGNRFLINLMRNISYLIALFAKRPLSYKGRASKVIDEHLSILKAISENDTEGYNKAILFHLRSAERYLADANITT